MPQPMTRPSTSFTKEVLASSLRDLGWRYMWSTHPLPWVWGMWMKSRTKWARSGSRLSQRLMFTLSGWDPWASALPLRVECEDVAGALGFGVKPSRAQVRLFQQGRPPLDLRMVTASSTMALLTSRLSCAQRADATRRRAGSQGTGHGGSPTGRLGNILENLLGSVELAIDFE